MLKNFINYYYNLLATEIRKIDDYYVLTINNFKYEFIPFYGNIDLLYNNYLLVINSYRYVHEIVLNKNSMIVTFYENIPYILIKKNIVLDKKLDLNYLINYDCIVNNKEIINWKKLWKEKIDYYEYQVSEIGYKYEFIKESFEYYIGMSELAISLLNYVNLSQINFYISHKRIDFEEKLDSFFNPINIIIDTRVRDIAEYLKINYINEKIKINDIIKAINNINFNREEAILLLSRLIYPSYYFDTYDRIIQQKTNESKLKIYKEKNVYYETFLKEIYKFLRYKYNIPQVEWLEI